MRVLTVSTGNMNTCSVTPAAAPATIAFSKPIAWISSSRSSICGRNNGDGDCAEPQWEDAAAGSEDAESRHACIFDEPADTCAREMYAGGAAAAEGAAGAAADACAARKKCEASRGGGSDADDTARSDRRRPDSVRACMAGGRRRAGGMGRRARPASIQSCTLTRHQSAEQRRLIH